uniref:Uncharacterized protein n=1 Tax=Rhizochromulina marina TaxID=1034831 RepID=A0A7S2R7H9_9STRA
MDVEAGGGGEERELKDSENIGASGLPARSSCCTAQEQHLRSWGLDEVRDEQENRAPLGQQTHAPPPPPPPPPPLSLVEPKATSSSTSLPSISFRKPVSSAALVSMPTASRAVVTSSADGDSFPASLSMR